MEKKDYKSPTLGIIELKLLSQILAGSGGVDNYEIVNEPEV